MNHQPEPQLEIHLPDEERVHELSLWKSSCRCGQPPWLRQRRLVGATKNEFQVLCSIESMVTKTRMNEPQLRENHTDPTPWMPSSAQAIQHWKMVALLTKL